MGLDMYFYGVTKINENDVPDIISTEWLNKKGYQYFIFEEKDNFDIDKDYYSNPHIADLVPYGVLRKCPYLETNWERIKEDNDLPKEAHIVLLSGDRIGFDVGKDKEIVYICVSEEDYDRKYTDCIMRYVFIYQAEQLAYWRKAYDLDDFLYDNFELGNTTWREIPEEFIPEIVDFCDANDLDPQRIEEEYDAHFYYEWY